MMAVSISLAINRHMDEFIHVAFSFPEKKKASHMDEKIQWLAFFGE